MDPSTKLRNVHCGLDPLVPSQHVSLVRGDYEYWHYCCDGTDDRGWGCGYRTLQTLCSWIRLQHQHSTQCHSPPCETDYVSSLPPTAGLVNSAGSAIPQDVTSGDTADSLITVIGSGDVGGDITNQNAASDDDNNGDGITVIASGNNDSAQNCQKMLCSTGSGGEQGQTSCIASSGKTAPIDLNSGVLTPAHAEKPLEEENSSQNSIRSDNSFVSGSKAESIKQNQLSQTSEETTIRQAHIDTNSVRGVPSLAEIQEALVRMGDKPRHFVGSRQWIGSYEVCLCLDYFYDVPCKIVHISQGAELKHHLSTLQSHFSTLGSPVMMGGDSDASSKGIVGVCLDPGALLVVDPHYSGKRQTVTSLQRAAWVKWVPVEDFHPTSFYNLCLPQLAAGA